MLLIPSSQQTEVELSESNCGKNSKQGKSRKVSAKIVLPVLLLSLPACSASKNIASIDTNSSVLTSSVSQAAVEKEGIASTDAELIKSVVAESENSNTLAWQNPDTGNTGTITAINNFVGDEGQQCKKFQTTVTSFMGISLYNGETCELRKGFWVLSWFLKQEA